MNVEFFYVFYLHLAAAVESAVNNSERQKSRRKKNKKLDASSHSRKTKSFEEKLRKTKETPSNNKPYQNNYKTEPSGTKQEMVTKMEHRWIKTERVAQNVFN